MMIWLLFVEQMQWKNEVYQTFMGDIDMWLMSAFSDVFQPYGEISSPISEIQSAAYF